ncbi:MAG: tetratricopeptide repeat protein [candidate division KSB1 bacterium]|nr:tetratricopeptide repeat protein [candidate division KSB1 bacterium]
MSGRRGKVLSGWMPEIALAILLAIGLAEYGCAPTAQQQSVVTPEQEKARLDSLRRVWEFERNKAWSTAYENYKNKLYDRSIKPFWDVIGLDTTRVFKDLPFRYLADCYFRLGMLDSAEVVYRLGLQVFPTSQPLHRNLGYLYMGREQIPEAIEHYEKAVTVDSGTVDDYRILGNLYVRNNQLHEAIRAYEKVLELDPSDETTRKALAQLYKSTGRTDEALNAMERALEADPQNARLLYDLGKAYYDRQDFEKALEKFLRLHQLNPDDVEAMMYVGDCYSELQQYPKAIQYFERVLQKDARNTRALCEIALAYKELGQFAKARTYANRALQIDPNFGMAYVARGEIYQAAADQCSSGRDIKFDDKLVYKLAYDEFQKAKQDPAWSDYAQRMINYLQQLIPTKEDYFFHPNEKEARLDCYSWIYR